MATLNPQIDTLTELRDHLAVWMGIPLSSGYAGLGPEETQIVDTSIARALRVISRDIKGQWIERKDSFTTGVMVTSGDVRPTIGMFGDTTVGSEVMSNIKLVVGGGNINPVIEGVQIGDVIAISGEGNGFARVAAVSATQITLEEPVKSATAVSEPFTVYRDIYDLADGVLWLIKVWDGDTGRELQKVGREDLMRLWSEKLTTGNPLVCMIEGADTTAAQASGTGTGQRLRIHPIPTDARTIKYAFYTLPTFPSAGGNRLEVSPVLIDLLIHKSLEIIFWQRQEPEERDRHKIEYNSLLRAAIKEEMGRGDIEYVSHAQWGEHDDFRGNFPDFIVAPFPIGV